MTPKSIFTSVTFWGAVTTLIGSFAPQVFVWLGHDPTTVAAYATSAVGFAITVYGRMRATQPVTLTGK